MLFPFTDIILVKDPEKNALDGVLLLLCHEPTATQLNLVPVASSGRVFTLDQLEIDHQVSIQANTIKQFVEHGGNGCRSPQPIRPASKNYCQNHLSITNRSQAAFRQYINARVYMTGDGTKINGFRRRRGGFSMWCLRHVRLFSSLILSWRTTFTNTRYRYISCVPLLSLNVSHTVMEIFL